MPAPLLAMRKAAGVLSCAYIAGFLDGEGYVTIKEANRCTGYWSYRAVVGFVNRNITVLKAIQAEYGGGIHAKRRYSAKHSEAFELTISRLSEVNRILVELLPFLIVKREQALIGLALLDLGKVKVEVIGSRRIHASRGGTHPIIKAASGEREKRQQLQARLQELNRRGPTCLQ